MIMSKDDECEPKLGKIRSGGARRGKSYLKRVLRAAALAGVRAGKRKFTGSRIGRGAGAGSVLAARDHHAAFRSRRVIIKSRIVKIRGKGSDAARVHLRYIQRDGVTRDGAAGKLYGKDQDEADGSAFLKRGEGDRHQFRFIVSPEDGDRYEDLKPFVRRIMSRMEEDLGTKLDWVAVDHFNTGHPHTHVILAGRDDRGKDLIIARHYLSQGMRERACELVTFDFGPRSDADIENKLRQEVSQERFTSLDRRLLKGLESGVIQPRAQSAFQQSLLTGRLQKLDRLGLATELAPGTWSLSPDLEAHLRDMGLRGDIINTMRRELAEKRVTRAPSEYAIYTPTDGAVRPLVGKVVTRGLSDEINDRHYLIIDCTDGYSHYVDIGVADDTLPIREGGIVSVTPTSIAPKPVDRTIMEIAAANGGRYDPDIHLRHDPSATADFAATHVRRLEAIRRATGKVERTNEGTWMIAPDHPETVEAFERQRARQTPVVIQILSQVPLERQVGADGATWLDAELVSAMPTPLRESGFGTEAKAALDRRRQWLIAQELAREEEGRMTYRANLLGILRRRDVLRAGAQLSKELDLNFAEARPGQRVTGTYRKPVDLVSGRFAVIETPSREFTLVPWRPVLERNVGKSVAGIAREEGISWTIGRQRGRGL